LRPDLSGLVELMTTITEFIIDPSPDLKPWGLSNNGTIDVKALGGLDLLPAMITLIKHSGALGIMARSCEAHKIPAPVG
jgi:hypothetical protein